MKTKLAILVLVTISSIFSIAGNAQSDQEDYNTVVNFFDSITNTYADLGDTTNIQSNNKPISSGEGDIVTSDAGPLTVYMIAQGWPAVICRPGENPNVAGKCFVDEGVNLENTLIYSAGTKDALEGTSASLSIRDKQIVFNNTSQIVTISLQVYVYWIRHVCDSSTEIKDGTNTNSNTRTGFSGSDAGNGNGGRKQKVIRFAEGGGTVDEGGSSSCSTTNGTWDGWLSQTIPTPQEFKYNKIQNMTYVISPLMKLVNTPLTKAEFGFGIEGYLPSYSASSLLESILQKNTTPKNENVSMALSFNKNYYRIVWDEKRQIYYGELINVSNPPKIEVERARLFYDYANKTVSSLQIDNGTILNEFWIMSPFGKKNVTILAIKKEENKHNKDIVVVVSIILVFLFVFFCFKKIIGR